MASEHPNWEAGWRPPSVAALGAALRRRREDRGLTLDTLAAATGISKPYLSNIETARLVGPPSEEKLRVLAHALELPTDALLLAADWLRTPATIRTLLSRNENLPRREDGAIDLDALLHTKAAPAPPARHSSEGELLGVRQIPLINRIAAGRPTAFGDMDYPRGVGDAYVPAPAPESPDAPPDMPTCLFALRVSGDSMEPDYHEGDILFVGSGDGALDDGTDCVVRMGESGDYATTFKRIQFLRDHAGEATAVRLVPLNPSHAPWTVPLEDISGIYPVVYRLLPVKRAAMAPPAPAPAAPRQEFGEGLSLEHD